MCVVCEKNLKVIEHKSLLSKFKQVYSSFLRLVKNEFFSSLGDKLSQSAVESAITDALGDKTESFITERLQKLELSIANGTVRQTLRGTPLRNLREGLTGVAKEKFLNEVATRATSINETMKDHIRVIAKDVIENNGTLLDFQEALKLRLKEEITQGKADVIARTEYRSAYTYGQNDAVEKLADKGHKVIRTWRTSGTNTRASHEIDGEERGVGEPFSNGLLYPMEPGAPIEEVINCNCSLDISVEET